MIIITLFWMLVPKTLHGEAFSKGFARESRASLITLAVFGVVFRLGEKEAFLRTALERTTWS